MSGVAERRSGQARRAIKQTFFMLRTPRLLPKKLQPVFQS
jgi:hypothetical protein